MTPRLWQGLILGLQVVTPAASALAQSNPWYIPPQNQASGYATAPYQSQSPYGQQQLQQNPYGLGAGYSAPLPQQQAPSYVGSTYSGSVQAPSSYGSQGQAVFAPNVTTGTTTGMATYQPAQPQLQHTYASSYQTQQQPLSYQPPPQVFQPQVFQPQVYQPQVLQQPLGNYPPLGSDPTELTRQTSKAAAEQRARSEPAKPTTTPAPTTTSILQHPGFGGPSTLSPGYGSYGGLTPMLPAPYGVSPYLGLPLY